MNIVILGAGLAGVSAAHELRTQGHDGEITLLGSETHPPYERPPLSKGVLLGSAEPDSVFVHPNSWYAENEIKLITGATATGIDLDTRHVTCTDRRISYDHLLVATGARPRRLPMADESGARVVYLRTLDDALGLLDELTGHLLIVGAGWIGLEVAAAARQVGGTVTVVERAPLPLASVLGPELAPVFADLHREHGVDLRLGATITEIRHAGGRTRVQLGDGTDLTPNLIVVGIGAGPNDHLATRAGLATQNGVLVDAQLRSSDPHVYAAGDVAAHAHPVHGRLRVEHWDSAVHQGRHVARAMLGDDAPYSREPYFFTDQYDLGMEYVGHVPDHGGVEVVIRGDIAKRRFTALWVHDDQVVAGMHVNDWDAIDPIRALVGRRATAPVRDRNVPLNDLNWS